MNAMTAENPLVSHVPLNPHLMNLFEPGIHQQIQQLQIAMALQGMLNGLLMSMSWWEGSYHYLQISQEIVYQSIVKRPVIIRGQENY
ncbi:hypothetical protein FGO68_gene15613 [Halteria grandinella]|uniref:Uncharacterized protein n=1 Tax=Halteria grandinella TaxID=5974 RepID=A0A8J8NWV6_HALGN|nr:hypothetical protein FGO68_gene15613 [Halteria grandinella]